MQFKRVRGMSSRKESRAKITNEHTWAITKLDEIITSVDSFVGKNWGIMSYVMSCTSVRIPQGILSSWWCTQIGRLRVVKIRWRWQESIISKYMSEQLIIRLSLAGESSVTILKTKLTLDAGRWRRGRLVSSRIVWATKRLMTFVVRWHERPTTTAQRIVTKGRGGRRWRGPVGRNNISLN